MRACSSTKWPAVVCLAAALMAVGAAQAAVVVNWQSTGALSNGVSAVATTGTMAYAYNTGSTNTYIVNGVTFVGTAAGGVTNLNNQGNVIFNPVDSGGTVAAFNNLAGDFGSLLDSAQWGTANSNNTITLGNLTVGQKYLVQVFSSDNRAGRDNILQLDQGTPRQFDSVSTGATNGGAYVIGTFTADATQQAAFTFRYLATSGNANINAIQVRAIAAATNSFVHPGIALSVQDLDHVKARLNVEPWKTGYSNMLASPLSSLSYTMKGPFDVVGRVTNNGAWENDMEAVHSLARQWYFTGNAAYAQKAHDILIAWATTHTLWNNESGTYLTMGYECMHVFEGADILRGTWPGWTTNDTDTVKAYFENVWWDVYHLSVPYPLRSANQGMAQFTAALGVAIFNDDQEKFDQCLQVFLTDAAAALGSTLPNGQVGDTGRDAHDQGQLMLMAWAAEAFWKQGVDVYSAFDNRMLAAAEYLSRYNLLVDTPFIQHGTVYDVYPKAHSLEGEYANYAIETKMLTLLHGAYVVRKGMRAPYLEKYFSLATQNKDSFCYLKATDTSTATLPAPVTPPAGVASVTSLSQTNIGDCTAGSATYNAGTKTWTVTGRGSSLSSSSADFRFAYLPVTGNATIIAKLTSLSGSDSNARAGVVITETLAESSKMQVKVISNPGGDNKLYSFWRGAVASSHNPTGGSGSRNYPTMPDPKVPYWIKIERIGNRINSYSSPDGASWSCGESADYTMGSTAYVGLAVSSDDNNSLATATFTNVRITGGDGGEAPGMPAAPFAVYASPDETGVTLRWLESFEADYYNVLRATALAGPYAIIAQVAGTSFVDTNASAGGGYYYAVTAVNSIGESSRSKTDFTRTIPTHHEVENNNGQSGLQWETCRDFWGGTNTSFGSAGDWCRFNNVSIGSGDIFIARVASGNASAAGQLEVRLGSALGTLVGTATVPYTEGWQNWKTVSTPLSATPGTYSVYLRFADTNATGSSAIFNLNWFDLIQANAPTHLRATPISSSRIDLAWDAMPGATAYRLKRSTVSGGPYVQLTSTNLTSHSDTGLSAGTSYYYVVSAVYDAVESADSAEVAAVPSAPIRFADVALGTTTVTPDGVGGQKLSTTVPVSGLGHNYRMKSTASLTAPVWENASGVIPGNGGELLIEVPINPSDPQRFHRLEATRQ